MIGKDILRFHAVYWPAFLMGAGIEVPRAVFIHGMLLRGGQKMGKTLGNAIQLDVLHRYFTNDQIRYYLLRDVAFGQDGEVTYQGLIDRSNSDLADGLGNLASRALTMIRSYFGGIPPRPEAKQGKEAAELAQHITESKRRFDEEFGALNFSRALEAAWAGIARVDKFITDKQPWKLAKDPSAHAHLESVIATSYEALRNLVLLVAPALPVTSREIWSQMGLSGDPLGINPNDAIWGEALEMTKIDRISPAFPKLDKDKIMTEIENDTAPELVEGAKPLDSGPAQPVVVAAETAGPATAAVIGMNDFIRKSATSGGDGSGSRSAKGRQVAAVMVDLGEAQLKADSCRHGATLRTRGCWSKIIVVANLFRKLRGLESMECY
jgi:methionyl-tRNA synthetase